MEEVLNITGLSRSMIYKLQRQEAFPRPIQLGERAVGWYEDDIALWIDSRRATRPSQQHLPLIYMAGRMGIPEDNKAPGAGESCWRMFDVSHSSELGELEVDTSPADVLIAPPEKKHFYGTNVSFLYSGPWKARGSYHGYIHGITSCAPNAAHSAAYRGATQGIARADVLIAYLEDLEAFGTLVEIGYARALDKKLIVITTPAVSNAATHELWFAIKAADRHINLPAGKATTPKDYWRLAHTFAAGAVAEWYPTAAVR